MLLEFLKCELKKNGCRTVIIKKWTNHLLQMLFLSDVIRWSNGRLQWIVVTIQSESVCGRFRMYAKRCERRHLYHREYFIRIVSIQHEFNQTILTIHLEKTRILINFLAMQCSRDGLEPWNSRNDRDDRVEMSKLWIWLQYDGNSEITAHKWYVSWRRQSLYGHQPLFQHHLNQILFECLNKNQ